MDHAHARDIAIRAEKVRPNLDGSAALRLVFLLIVLIYAAVMMSLASLHPWLLSQGVSPQSLKLYPGVALLFSLTIAGGLFDRRNRRRLRRARETMLCPQCRAVLRDDGPAHWRSCDETIRACPSCSETITDEVYAAAALPMLQGEMLRRANRRPSWIALAAAPLALYLACFVMFRPVSDWLERRGHEDPRFLLIPVMGVGLVVTVAIALITLMNRTRAIKLAAAGWLDAPFCPACDTRFPEGSLDSTILRCAACDTRLSTAAGIVDSLTARAIVGRPTPVPWPRGQQTPPRTTAPSGESHSP